MSEVLPELSWKNFSACLIVLGNVQEVFACFIVTDFMLKTLGFFKDFGF